MPQILSRALVLSVSASCMLGCSGRFQRSKYDPFASVKSSSTERTANDYPQLVQPGNADDEVTQASREFYSRQPGAIRAQRPRDLSDSLFDTSGGASWDSLDANKSTQSTARPPTGRTLEHAPDYSWIQGKLEHTYLSGGIWRVRYAPLSADDEHGGCVILHSPPNIQQFRVGDMVYVEGQIIEPSTRGPLPNPVYRVDLMNRVAGTSEVIGER